MITLGIETSCDETSCAVIKDTGQILSNIISSSLFRHQPFGGVVPEIASRHCLEQIDTVYEQALDQAGITESQIDLIAVTQGPGLIGSLFTGVCFAKALSYRLQKPLVGVNHLEAHIAANFIEHEVPETYVGLLVSGGHTSVTYFDGSKTTLVGETVDDACGEAYDKVAKLLNLGYPGGPIIDRLAKEGDPKKYRFTRPKLKDPNQFSFSGIKTAVLYLVREQESVTEQFQKDLAASFQTAVVSWVVDQTFRVAEEKNAKYIVVGGGVSANSALRASLKETAEAKGINVLIPPLVLTGDNAAMVARHGYDLFARGQQASLNLTANPNLQMNLA